jgi:hypothetical protein
MPINIATTTVIRGPAYLVFNGKTIVSEGDVKVTLNKEMKEKKVNFAGTVAQKLLSASYTISFTPDGLYGVLFPYANTRFGAPIFGTTNVPLEIVSTNGTKYNFKRVAITKLSSLELGVEKGIVGEVEFTAIKDPALPFSDPTAFFTKSSNTYTDPAVSLTRFRDGPFTILYDGAEMATSEGVTINFNTSFADVKIDSDGLIEQTLSSFETTANFSPVTLNEDAYIALLGVSGIERGGLITGKTLEVSDPVDRIITLGGMVASSGGFNFGAEVDQNEAVEFKSTRIIGPAGVPGAWFDINLPDDGIPAAA